MEGHTHTFIKSYFKNPTWCTHCGTFIWGILPGQQKGWSSCQATFHGFCRDQIEGEIVIGDEALSPRGPDASTAESMMKSIWPLIKDNLDEELRNQCTQITQCSEFASVVDEEMSDDEQGFEETCPEHFFENIYLPKPTWCSHCGTFIWGILPSQQQALQCSGCKIIIHGECKAKIAACPSLQMQDSGHIVVSTIFKYPTWCSHCNSFIWNPSACGLAVHESCKETMLGRKCSGGSTKTVSPQTVGKIKHIPTRYMSQLWGSTTSTQYPLAVQTQINLMYAWVTGCNLEEAEKPPSEYISLNHFFKRRLKAGARAIDDNALLVSPVDGRLIHFGKVDTESAMIEQVKGVDFSLKDFMGPDSSVFETLKRIKESPGNTCLFYCVLYLAPGDYHGFHSPCVWQVEELCHFPGHLFPVNSWATTFIKGLFAMNERVVLTGHWKHGFFSYTPVGAYNVGSISLNWEQDLTTNVSGQNANSQPLYQRYENPLPVGRAENVGFFNLGSSIIMVFEAPINTTFSVPRSTKLKLGTPLVI